MLHNELPETIAVTAVELATCVPPSYGDDQQSAHGLCKSEVLYRRGLALFFGTEAHKCNWARAASCFVEASRSFAHLPSLIFLAHVLRNGLGVPQDETGAAQHSFRVKAFLETDFIRHAWDHRVEQGGALGMLEAAWLCDDSGDETGSARWRRRAANAGSVMAMYELALQLMDGRGVPADDHEALRLLREAQPLPAASSVLGQLSEEAGDTEAAYRLYRAGAADGDPTGMKNLAAMHDTHNGNVRVASKWLRNAAENGDWEAAQMHRLLPSDQC
eukprot:TRINITY_DN26634_c0_g1_i1.p1 TRINITY_DN26634_c0_g1~~TRINITY_DN26634_c0_g1_i1.p1  ORF type:complete len:274 (+),score=59.77 TRINITY_DN26634_c0_g1_i1:64-885(+)